MVRGAGGGGALAAAESAAAWCAQDVLPPGAVRVEQDDGVPALLLGAQPRRRVRGAQRRRRGGGPAAQGEGDAADGRPRQEVAGLAPPRLRRQLRRARRARVDLGGAPAAVHGRRRRGERDGGPRPAHHPGQDGRPRGVARQGREAPRRDRRLAPHHRLDHRRHRRPRRYPAQGQLRRGSNSRIDASPRRRWCVYHGP